MGWNMNNIINDLIKLQDKNYRDFQVKLFPTLSSDTIIGVRTPVLRSYAKKMVKEKNYVSFLEELPHKYFDENQLHAFIISELKNCNECIIYVNNFLPYIDNWATCDQMSPGIFRKNHNQLLDQIRVWINSKETYTVRFGIGMLMQHFLDNDFKSEYLNLVSSIKSEEYYINMMRAWYFATALAKQYEEAIKFLEEQKLDTWTHNKTIQKAIESYRITASQKEYLKGLKIK